MTRPTSIDTRTLCIVDHAIPARHGPGCPGPDCTGCLRPLAAPGSQACAWHDTRARAILRRLPGWWTQLGESLTTRHSAGSAHAPAVPIPLAHIDARTRIQHVIQDWCLTLYRTWHLTLPTPTIHAMSSHVATHTSRILAHPDYAADLLADILGTWTCPEPLDGQTWEETQPIWTPGLDSIGTLLDPPTTAVRLLCDCGHRIPLDPTALAMAPLLTCGQCGARGTLDQWRARQAPETIDPLPLRDLPGWLLVHRGLTVTWERLRSMTRSERGTIVAVPEHIDTCTASTCPGCRRPRRYDPAQVAAALRR